MSSASTDAPDAPVPTLESAVEHAKRAFALGKYEQAVDHYATALELITEQHGEHAPQTADLYFAYGRALLENAIAQNSVLGKEQPEGPADADAASTSAPFGAGPILSFSGDAEDAEDGDGDGGDDPAVDLFSQAAREAADDASDEDQDDGDADPDAEPEDDFNAAWEVLDLARAIYDKQVQSEDDDEVKLKLADTYIALGDVSLETEKFDQAITDYEAGLKLKLELLPVSSRQIAEAHYKLSMVLDLTSGRLSDAIVHAEKALESVEHRLAVLRQGLSGQLPPQPEETDVKGKGKSTGTRLARDDLVQNMTTAQIEGEIKELEGLKDDLALKVDELKTSPNDKVETSAPVLAAQALDKELNNGTSAVVVPPIVNDLTSMVVKKKKKNPETAAGKRKADEDVDQPNSEKKVKLDEPQS